MDEFQAQLNRIETKLEYLIGCAVIDKDRDYNYFVKLLKGLEEASVLNND